MYCGENYQACVIQCRVDDPGQPGIILGFSSKWCQMHSLFFLVLFFSCLCFSFLFFSVLHIARFVGSARGSSRQGSESGDPIPAIMDEAVEAATEAAAEAAAAAGHSDATDMEAHQTAACSDGVLPTRNSNDSQSQGSSPEAALAVPLEGGSSSHTRLTPPPSRLTPPPSSLTHPPPSLGLGAADLGWGLADRLRYMF